MTYVGETERVTLTFRGAVAISSVSAATDTFTSAAHGLVDGDAVMLRAVSGTLPTPIYANITYYVVGAASGTFQVATVPGGSAVALTDVGSGPLEVIGPKDPSGAITLVVETPAGVETTYTYALAEITKLTTAVYYRDVTFTAAGLWRLKCTGVMPAGTVVLQRDWVVLASNV
jgi:hypothetical protein